MHRLPAEARIRPRGVALLHLAPLLLIAAVTACTPLAVPSPPAPTAPAFSFWPPVAAVGLHTLCHLLVAGVIAFVVYEKVGLAALRRAWFNLDYLWAGALVLAGVMAAVL